MLRFLFLFLFIAIEINPVLSQTVEDSIPDSAGVSLPDTIIAVQQQKPGSVLQDSVSKRPETKWVTEDSIPLFIQVLNHHPFFKFNTTAVAVYSDKKQFKGQETLFYSMAGLLIFFSLLRLSFGKYFNDLFRVFFRTTLKQRQIKEQLIQNPLPSFGFNIFFIATAGLYIDFLLHHINIIPVKNFWLLYAYCCLGLTAIYFVKFVTLKICGWLFNMKNAADAYIFIVFIINKVIGIFLLPIIILIAFMDEPVYSIVFLLSWVGIGLLFLYRFILGYAAIRNEVRFNLFHFFLYLCAFEIAPLLLIYKLLLLVF